MSEIKVICVFDGNKPEIIPSKKWVKFGKTYTINKLMVLRKPIDGVLGVTLHEIKLTEKELPYKYFKLERFKVLDSTELLIDVLEKEMTINEVEVLEYE